MFYGYDQEGDRRQEEGAEEPGETGAGGGEREYERRRQGWYDERGMNIHKRTREEVIYSSC